MNMSTAIALLDDVIYGDVAELPDAIGELRDERERDAKDTKDALTTVRDFLDMLRDTLDKIESAVSGLQDALSDMDFDFETTSEYETDLSEYDKVIDLALRAVEAR